MINKKKFLLLVVEDETAVVEALEDEFTGEGFEILTASNGKIGLSLALRKQPDLILLDIVMPVMDGITMLEKLRKEKNGRKIPVIMLTNLSDSKMVEEARKKGVNDYLVKAEWTLADLVKKVKSKLSL